MRRVFAAVAVVVAALVPSGAPVHAQGGPRVEFITPSEGMTVAGPVEVALSVSNFTLVPAGSQTKEGVGHAHVLVDQEPPAPRTFLPTNDPSVVHMGAAPFDTRAIELSDGPHTLYAVLGDSDHLVVEHQPVKINVTVAPGVHARGALEPACADIARGSGEVRIAFPLQGGALQGTVTATCQFATGNGKCTWSDAAFRRVNGTWDPSTAALAGTAPGYTTRQLKSGSRGDCGPDQTTALGKQTFAASVSGAGIRGTLGRSSFTLTEDPASRLAPPPPVVAAESDAEDDDGGRSWIAYLPFAGAAVLLAGAAYYVIKNRDAGGPESALRH